MKEFFSKHISALAILAVLSLATAVGITAINRITAIEFSAQTTGLDIKGILKTIQEFFPIENQRAIINANQNEVKDAVKKFWMQNVVKTKGAINVKNPEFYKSINKLDIVNFRKQLFSRIGVTSGPSYFTKQINESAPNCAISNTGLYNGADVVRMQDQLSQPAVKDALIKDPALSGLVTSITAGQLEFGSISDPSLRSLAKAAAILALQRIGVKYVDAQVNFMDSLDCILLAKTNIKIPDIKKFGSTYNTLVEGAKSTVATVKQNFTNALNIIKETLSTYIKTFVPRLYAMFISIAAAQLASLIGGNYNDSKGQPIVVGPNDII
jgi:hypothetical protein